MDSNEGERKDRKSPPPAPPASAGGEEREQALTPTLSPAGERGLRHRHDGFTPKKRKRFVKVLRKTGCVRDACRRVGISSTSAYRTRRKLAGFAKQWDTALDMASVEIEAVAWQRAVEGVEEPVWHYGKQVGTRIRRSDSILRLLLQGSNPKKYGRSGAVGARRLVKEERERIEREVRAEIAAGRPSFEEAIDALDRQLVALGHRRGIEAGRAAPDGES